MASKMDVLTFFDELSTNEKDNLITQMKKIDFNFMNELYKNSHINDKMSLDKLSSLTIINKNSDNYSLGEDLVKNGYYGVLLMAGGMGSRLGLNEPKGCLKIKVKGKEISLFELYINELKEVNSKYNITIPLYIMTSKENNEQTIKFFKENNYFDYDIKFFSQNELPILDIQGNLLLKNKHEILFGPNGNGDVFVALKENNIIDDMKKKNLKYILFSSIDNVVANMVDFNFIGTTLKYNYELSSKTLTKKDDTEKGWIFCKYNNKPSMLPNEFQNKDINNKKINNEYIYREKNIACHLISLDNIIKLSNIDLRYHRAFKKNSYIDSNGNLIVPNKPNTFKFEKYIFDAFSFTDDMLLYRINDDDFCPIKEEKDIKEAEKRLNNI